MPEYPTQLSQLQDSQVMIVDPDQLFGAAIAAVLASDCCKVTVYGSARSALDQQGDKRVDLVVVDPYRSTPEAATTTLRQLRQSLPDARIIVLSADQSPAALRTSLSAGVDAHVSKADSPDVLRQALKLVAAGQSLFPAAAVSMIASTATPSIHGRSETAELSPRETQILSCLLGGMANKSIARRLSITESTVKMHFKNLTRKIGTANRTRAAIWALEHGIHPTLPA